MQAKLSSTIIKKLRPKVKAYEVVDTEVKGFLLRVQPTGRMTFYFSYRSESGQRKRIKIGTLGPALSIAQARDDAIVHSSKIIKGVDVQREKRTEKKKATDDLKNTLSNFMDEQYRPWALANLKSGQQTIDSIKRTFPQYLEQPLSEIHTTQIERWRTQRLQGGTKPATINRVVNALRAVLTKAVDWEVIEDHPLAKLKALKIDEGRIVRFLSGEEETRLYATMASRDIELKEARSRGNAFREKRGSPLMPDLSGHAYGDRMTPLIVLSLKTGMRRGELFDLDWDSVDLKKKIVTVEGETAKSGKTRHIPLSPTAYKVITIWNAQNSPAVGKVFPANNGGRLENVNTSWGTILNKSKIKSFRWHDMRHDFASKLVMEGAALNTVRELCGHADLNTTLRYAHLAEDHRAAAISLLG